MADFYCDHGAYASPLGATPTWGVPQEGDGSTINAATTSSIASITFATPPTTGGCNVFGVAATLTNVLNQANIALAADNLAASINATTTAVLSSFAIGTPALRNIVYARGPSNGAPAGTCQIMTRIGSSTLNVTGLTSTFNGAPTVAQFTGGSGGCWGTFFNPVAMGVGSSIAAGSYGVWLFKAYVGAPADYDRVYVRTGTNTAISYAPASASGQNYTATWSVNLVFDTNTKWTGDSATGTLSLAISHVVMGGAHFHINPVSGTASQHSEACLRKGNFKIVNNSATTGLIAYASGQSGGAGCAGVILLDGVEFEDNNTNASAYIALGYGGTGGGECTTYFKNVIYRKTVQATTGRPIATLFPSSVRGGLFFDDCYFYWNLTGGGNPGSIIAIAANAISYYCHLAIRNCVFDGYSSGYDLYSGNVSAVASDSYNADIVIENNSGIAMPASYLGLASSTHRRSPQNAKTLSYSDKNGGFRYENTKTVSEFVPGGGFPTLSSNLFDGATPWSMRLIWLPGAIHPSMPGFTNPIKVATRLTSAIRSITLEMYLPTSLSITSKLSGYVQFAYTDASGIGRTECVRLSDLVASAASWVANSVANYSAKKATLATTYALASNSEITAQVIFSDTTPTGARVDLYVNPDLTVA